MQLHSAKDPSSVVYPSRSSSVVSPHVRYKLDDCTSGSSNVVVDPRMTALYVQSSRLVGIDDPKEEIINLLTKQVGILLLLFWFVLWFILDLF